jgi:glycosyltransferase involved in cell wall biosynthesis
VRSAVQEFGSHLIMPRSLMPAVCVLAAGGSKLRPILFDADGLEADERVDVAGLSSLSPTYRILRDVEAQMVRQSKAILTRTAVAAEILYHRAGPPVRRDQLHVVANGRDENIFQPGVPETRAAVRGEFGIDDLAPLLVYAGSVGPQYRFEAVARLFSEVRRIRGDSRLLVLTGSPDVAFKALGNAAAASIIERVPPEEVPRILAAADVGLAYRSTSFSMQGVSPIKIGEYLLCGLPVIGTAAVGDTNAAVNGGLFFDDEAGSTAAARWFIEEVLPHRDGYRQRARALGQAHFSLRRSVEDYARALFAFSI